MNHNPFPWIHQPSIRSPEQSIGSPQAANTQTKSRLRTRLHARVSATTSRGWLGSSFLFFGVALALVTVPVACREVQATWGNQPQAATRTEPLRSTSPVPPNSPESRAGFQEEWDRQTPPSNPVPSSLPPLAAAPSVAPERPDSARREPVPPVGTPSGRQTLSPIPSTAPIPPFILDMDKVWNANKPFLPPDIQSFGTGLLALASYIGGQVTARRREPKAK